MIYQHTEVLFIAIPQRALVTCMYMLCPPLCPAHSSMTTSIIPSPTVGGKESYSLTIYDIQNQFIGKKIFSFVFYIFWC